MNTDHEKIRPHRSGFFGRLRSRTGVAILIFASVVTAFVVMYQSHLLYYFGTNTTTREYQVNVAPMPVGKYDEDFSVCRVGQLEFQLPHELANSMVRGPAELKKHKIYAAGIRRVHVIAPSPAFSLIDGFSVTDKNIAERLNQMTVPVLRIAAYQADASDFSWSMSSADLKWHSFLMENSKFLRLSVTGGDVESFSTSDLELIVHYGDARAALNWETTDHRLWGHMDFLQPGEMIDRNWVRAVSQSLKIVP